MPALDPPEKRYELVERIAVGGMAEVFRAKAYGPHGFEKVLAIKRILPALARDPSYERRFVTEAKVAVSLSHANIVQVFDFSRFGQSLYIVMELVDGGDLSTVLSRVREQRIQVPLEAALHVAVELLKGLDFAHRRGVVHRDVSPSNVLLSRSGEVKIADFGIAQAGSAEASRSIRIMGKWRYMSPEQTRGEELDPRSDVFATGAVLHELFTGQRLFPGDDAEEIVRNIRSMPLPRPSQVRPDLPPGLDGPLAAALERDRERRTITAGQLHQRILDVCYASGQPALPTSLARFLAGLDLAIDEGGSTTGSGQLIDQIIESELGGLGAAPRGGGRGRRTAMALGPPPLHPEDAPAEDGAPQRSAGELDAGEADVGEVDEGDETIDRERPESTGMTFIRSVKEADGTRRWLLDTLPPDDEGEEEEAERGRGAEPTADDHDLDTLTTVAPEPAMADRGNGPSSRRAGPPVRLPSVGDLPAPRSGLRLAVAGGALAAVILVVVLAISGGSGSPDRAGAGEERAGPGGAAERIAAAPTGRAGEDAEVRTAPEPAPDPPPAPPPEAEPVLEFAPDPLEPADAAPPAAPPAPRGDRPDRERRVSRAAAPQATHGTVDIYSEPWADIYLGTKKVGTAPQRGVRLPVGRHRLRLVNPVQKRTAWITVTVPSSRPVQVALPE